MKIKRPKPKGIDKKLQSRKTMRRWMADSEEPEISMGPRIFLPDLENEVRAIAARGYTDQEICSLFGIAPDIFEEWKDRYPDFRKALEGGRLRADGEVILSLFREATGYTYQEEVIAGKNPQRFRVTRFARPNVSAQQFWLTNRDKEHWSNRQSHDGGGREGGGVNPVNLESRTTVIRDILKLVSPKSDPKDQKFEGGGEKA